MTLLLSVLQSLFAALTTQILQSDFTMTVAANNAQPISYNGTIVLRNDSFMLVMPGVTAAYDGKTLYMYQEEVDELTLSYPTQEELLQTNPMLYAQAIAPLCHINERNTNNETIITLSPKNTSEPLTNNILGITLKVQNDHLTPSFIEVRDRQSTTQLHFHSPAYTNTHISFSLSEQDFPNSYINDLR
ncbi:MAG: outer membrane lipoprotein carrier protein LolA [Paludibacteraceae bacterium]|nr:outer membrane lipoprotein carrier protein LolA [Paludibacteraceae bacterium]